MNVIGRFRHAIKVVIAHVLYYTGLLQAWQRIVLRDKAVVLMYHRVLSPEEMRTTGSHPAIVVTPATFDRQMAVLKRRFAVLSVEEFAGTLKAGGAFPDFSCLITFDDGWVDNETNAVPILKRHGLPALIFLPVNFIGSRRIFWQETLTHLLVRAVRKARKSPACDTELRRFLAPAKLDYLLDVEDDDPRGAINVAVVAQKRMSEAFVDALLAGLASRLDDSLTAAVAGDGFMNWDAVTSLSRERITFGGHGAEHRLLTEIPGEEATAEIRESMDVLQRHVSPSVPTFSYPNGNWNPEVASKVEATGYQLAFTTQPGFVSRGDNRFALRRVNIHEASTASEPMFLAKLVGLF